MNLDGNKAENIFKKIKHVREEIKAVCLAPDRPHLSIRELCSVVSSMYKLEITAYEVPFEGEFLRGMIERYADKAVIFIRKGQSEEWKRFIAAKELCHIIADEPEDWSVHGETTISKLLAEHQLAGFNQLADPVVQSETFAEIGAIELLYPFKERVTDRGNGQTIASIASYYKIPDVIAEQALSDWYHEMSNSVWELIKLD